MFLAKVILSSPFQYDGNANLDGFFDDFDECQNKETPTDVDQEGVEADNEEKNKIPAENLHSVVDY